MGKRILALICLIAASFGLTGCGQKSSINNKNTEKTSQAKKQAPDKLTDQLSDNLKASAITVYAGMRYKKWDQLYKQATKNKLSVSVKNHTGFRIPGKGYIYEVSGNGKEAETFYTLRDGVVTFYNGTKKLGKSNLKQIVAYLNKKNKVQAVKTLAKKTKVGARITSDKYGVKGDDGLKFIPRELRGTWYSHKGKKLVVTEHTINGEEIHMIDSSSFAPVTLEQTKKWARARIENINGVDCYHVQSLNQQSFGLLYSLQKKKGEPAIATYRVATGDFIGSYWKSVEFARANRDAVFASLN